MKRIFLVLCICSMTAVCFGQQEYENSEWRFSLEVPYDWQAVAEEELLGKWNELFLDSILGEEPSLAVFQKRGAENENTAYMVVLCQTIGDPHAAIPEEVGLGRWYVSNACRSMVQGRMEWIRESLAAKTGDEQWRKPGTSGRIFYDEQKRILYETQVLSSKNRETFVLSIVRLLGSNRTATLVFHGYNENTEEFLDLIETVVESFSYDEKYGYGETTARNVVETLWVWLFPGIAVTIFLGIIFWWVMR